MTRKLSDLAVFGGTPTFSAPRHVNRPSAPPRAAFDALMDQVWDQRWFTNQGPLLEELEQRLAVFLDVPHCVLTSSATSALDLVLLALRIEGEVLLPSYTFISSAHLLHLRGLIPVFCDIGPEMTLDPKSCAARMSDKTGAVIATHVWGKPCDIPALETLCRERAIPLIFDAAHAFGSRQDGVRIGRFGSAEIFSLHATKAFHAAEGGLIATCDSALAEELRLMRNFGFANLDEVVCVGVNAKMSELHAALGLANLAAFPETVAAARRIHAIYRDGLKGLPGLTLKCPEPEEDNNSHYIVVEVEPTAFGLRRDDLVNILFAENILARRYFFPGGHLTLPHADMTRQNSLCLPQTEALTDRVMILPGGAAAEPEDVSAICSLIRFVADNVEPIAAEFTVKT